jgi:Sigma-54 interaction domain
MSDDFIEHRQKILIPAAFGIHSKIEDELRDAISRLFSHSTFFFHQVFLRRPVLSFQGPVKPFEEDPNFGTTQPFLSRFVYQSGLTPKVDARTVSKLSQNLKKELKSKTRRYKGVNRLKVRRALGADLLTLPLVATADESYHHDLEKLTFPLRDSIFLRGLLEMWLQAERDGSLPHWAKVDRWKEIFQKERGFPLAQASSGSNCYTSIIGSLNSKGIKEIYSGAVIDRVRDSIKAARAKDRKKEIESALDLLREYHVTLRPWIEDAANPAVVIAVSISSDTLFWGECVLILPGSTKNTSKSANRELVTKYQELVSIIARNVKSTFMPIMTVFENYVLERDLKNTWDVLDKKKRTQGNFSPLRDADYVLGLETAWWSKYAAALESVGMGHWQNVDKFTVPPPDSAGGNVFISLLCQCIRDSLTKKRYEETLWTKLNDIERSFVALWAARLSIIFFSLPKMQTDPKSFEADVEMIEDSLVFEKYLVASPAILRAIIAAMAIKHGELGTEKASIKTALVVGGPGSGKDSMAKLVRLFSPGYRFGKSYTLNMASFRPKEAAVPLLLGLDVNVSNGKFSVSSLLGRAWNEQRDARLSPPCSGSRGLSFIFDELNSLDLDTQGALLRFLESGELLALGDYKSPTRDVDALIIGVMNEDPNTITKVRTLDRIIKDKQVFGGMLGDFLYEFFRGQRRLRDDLYFRMARGGEIILPELRDRREDIPILFYFIVQRDLLPSLGKGYTSEIELSTYEELMDPALQWEGNVRELQALAREIFNIAVADRKDYARAGRNQLPRAETAGAITSRAKTITFRGSHVRRAHENLQRKVQPISGTLVHPA